MTDICIWQRMISPHMSGLAEALAAKGHRVRYIAEVVLSTDRAAMGWTKPALAGVELQLIGTREEAVEFANNVDSGTIHITQGFRSNGLIAYAQQQIQLRPSNRHYVIMETVSGVGPMMWLKQVVYGWHLNHWAKHLDGVLAIGHSTTDWLHAVAPKQLMIYPFAYFLPERPPLFPKTRLTSTFRFLFVGQLIERKRVGILLSALAHIGHNDFVLDLIGDGPESENLKRLAEKVIPGRARFLGTMPISEVPARMAQADCLILPSKHDGWGAVISEAMLVGTPVVCSTACGAAGVVQSSGFGGTFPADNMDKLDAALKKQLKLGTVTPEARRDLARWALRLGARAGASYFEKILESTILGVDSPPPFWEIDAEPEQITTGPGIGIQ